MFLQIVTALLVLSIAIPVGVFFIGERKANRFKSMLLTNVISFFGVLLVASVFIFSGTATAADATAVASDSAGLAYIAAAMATGLSTVGAGIATGQAASAALGALSENDSIMGKALIMVALAEGIAIYGLLMSFTILSRV